MAKEEGKAASLKPSDFSEATGLFEGRAAVTEAEFVMWDYDKGGEDYPMAKFVLQPEEGDPIDQYFSVGKAADWKPSKDGSELIAIGRATGINTSSNFSMLLASLVNAGYPEDKMTSDITDFVGLEAEFLRVPAPKRPGIKPKEGQEGREQTILTVGDIYKLPWEKKGKAAGKATAAKPAAGKKAAEPEEGGDLEDEATALVMEVLAENDGAVIKQKLPKFLFPKLKGNTNMKAILNLVQSDDFLGGDAAPWTYSDGELTM